MLWQSLSDALDYYLKLLFVFFQGYFCRTFFRRDFWFISP